MPPVKVVVSPEKQREWRYLLKRIQKAIHEDDAKNLRRWLDRLEKWALAHPDVYRALYNEFRQAGLKKLLKPAEPDPSLVVADRHN